VYLLPVALLRPLVSFADLLARAFHDALDGDRFAARLFAFLGGDHEGHEVDRLLGRHGGFLRPEEGADRLNETLVIPAAAGGGSLVAGDLDLVVLGVTERADPAVFP